jgi:hypothetical protein
MVREKRVQIRCPVGSETDFLVPKKLKVNEEYARETFNLFDRKRVGFFTDKDINRLFSTSKQQLKEFTDRFDENGDGNIEWHEFLGTMSQFVEEKGDLNFFERIYVTVSEPGSSVVSKWISLIIMALIILSTLSFVMDTVPNYKLQKKDPCCCKTNIEEVWSEYYDDDFESLESCQCEPQSNPIFFWTEFICIFIFTIEYLLKLCTCWASRFGSEFELILDVVTVPKTTNYPKMWRVYNFVTNTMNLIDLLAILPFYFSEVPIWMDGKVYALGHEKYVEQDDAAGDPVMQLSDDSPWCAGSGGGGNLGFLRVLRLMRVFRVFKMGKYSKGMQLFSKVMIHSMPALKLLCFFTLLGMILFGSMIYIFEKGHWMTTPAYPDGAYMRQDLFNKDLDMSPFTSIPSCFWWVIVTQTTVGYGDSYPTTELGKIVGSVCMISGVLVLALPITIIGANFANEYAKVQAEEARERHQLSAAQAKLEAEEMKRKKRLAKQGIEEPPPKPKNFMDRMLAYRTSAKPTGKGGSGEKIAPEVGGNSKDGGWTEEFSIPEGVEAPSSPVLSVDAGSDSDEEDISDIDLIKEHMGNMGGELIGLIRDYIDADRITKVGGDSMLFEINELMKMLNQKEITAIPVNSVHGMLTVAWHWIARCESDDTVVLLPAHKIKLLKAFWDFSSSTQRSPD